MNWSILGIEPTTDKAAIAAAYRSQLRTTNPEDHPEEFKALRTAYEEASRLADEAAKAAADAEAGADGADGAGSEDQGDVADFLKVLKAHDIKADSPVGRWLGSVAAVYDDFQARINPNNWSALLQDDACMILDQRPKAEDVLFHYLMDHWFLPQTVWKLIVDEFAVLERAEDFYGRFGKEFVDYAVVRGALVKDNLPYELFTPGVDAAQCDAYRALYNEGDEGNSDASFARLVRMKGMSETHPYGDALYYSFLLGTDQDALAREKIFELGERFADYAPLAMMRINLLMQEGDGLDDDEDDAATGEDEGREGWRIAWEAAKHLVELDPDNLQAKIVVAECTFRNGQPDDAKKMAFDMIESLGNGNPAIRQLEELIESWNEMLIFQMEEKFAAASAGAGATEGGSKGNGAGATEGGEPFDPEEKLELGWCYMQNERIDDAGRMCDEVLREVGLENMKDPYNFHNLMGRVCLAKEQHEDCIEHLDWLVDYLRHLEDDGTEKTASRLARLPLFMKLKVSALFELDRTDEAHELMEQISALEPESPEVLAQEGLMAMANNDFATAVGLLEQASAKSPDSPLFHYHLSRALFESHRDNEAFQEANIALEQDPSNLPVYTHKLDILIRNRAWEPAHELMDFFKENGLEGTGVYDWYVARLVEEEDGDTDKALELYRALAERLENGEGMEHPDDLFYNICFFESRKLDLDKAEDIDHLLAIADKGLEFSPNDMNLLDIKGWLLKRAKRNDEALAVFHRLEAFPSHSLNVERALAELYYRDLGTHAEDSLRYYSKITRVNPDDDVAWFYTGHCLRYLRRFDEGEQAFQREIELAPDDVDGYRGLSITYEYAKRYDEMLEQIDIMLDEERSLVPEPDKRADLLYRKHKIYRRMGFPDKALRMLDQADRTDPSSYYIWRAKFDVLTQFGLWDDARRLLDEWAKTDQDGKARFNREVLLQEKQGNFEKAKELLKRFRRKMDKTDVERRLCDIAEAEEDLKGQLDFWEKRAANPEDSDRDQTLAKLASVHARMGNAVAARTLARQALEIQEAEVVKKKHLEPLFHARMALSLALLGRDDEARERAELARGMHLCEMCTECRCKDMDIYEVWIAELSGDLEGALELAHRYARMFPGEEDFKIAISRLERKLASGTSGSSPAKASRSKKRDGGRQ